MVFIGLFVIFLLVVGIWLLGLMGVIPNIKSEWLAWIAVVILGITFFLVGMGWVPYDQRVR